MSTAASAAQLVLFPIPTGSSNVVPDPVAANMSSSNISVFPDAGPAVSSTSRTAFLRASADAVSEAGAVGSNDYWEFTLTADSGFQLDLDEITFPFGGSSSEGDFNTFFFVRTDLDNYATTIGSNDVLVPNGTAVSGSNYEPAMLDTMSISLSGDPTYQGLDSISFRIYAYSDGSSSNQISRMSQIEVLGDVTAIPEPGVTAALLGLAGMLAVIRMRRR